MKKSFIFFLAVYFNLVLNGQYFYCNSKTSEVKTLDSLNYVIKNNYKPLNITVRLNQTTIKSIKNTYKKNYTRFFRRDTPVPHSIPPFTHHFRSAFAFVGYYKFQSVIFFIDSLNKTYIKDNNSNYSVNTSASYPFTSSGTRYINSYYYKHPDSLDFIFFDSLRRRQSHLPYLKDSFIRQPLQFYINSERHLFIMDENNQFKPAPAGGIFVDTPPKISIVNADNGKWIRNIPLISEYIKSRQYFDNDNIKYNNFAVMKDKLYLAYSYNNKDSLGVFNLKENFWEKKIKLNDTNFFNHIYGYPYSIYSPLGNSRVRVSKNEKVYIAENRGNIYELNLNTETKRVITNSNTPHFGFIDEFTRNYYIDGFENLYIPDFKNGKIIRFFYNDSIPEIIVDSIFMGCESTNSIQYARFAPTNIQLDCDANLYAEIDPIDSLKFKCLTKFHVKWESEIDTTFTLSKELKCGDTLTIIANFIDGDSVVNKIIKPSCFVNKTLNINTCSSYSFNGKTYLNSGSYIDTIVSFQKPDTITTLNIVIFPNFSDTQEINICNKLTIGDSIYNKSGVYPMYYKSAQGCDSIIYLYLNTKGVSADVEVNNQREFKAKVPNLKYQWYLCQPYWRKIENAINQSFTTTTQSSFALIVKDSSGQCRDTSQCVDKYYLSIHGNTSSNLTIYPNPFTDKIYIDNPKSEKFSVQLNDLQGKIIAKSQTIASKSYMLELDKYLPKGLYFLEIKTESETSFYKILKVE